MKHKRYLENFNNNSLLSFRSNFRNLQLDSPECTVNLALTERQ